MCTEEHRSAVSMRVAATVVFPRCGSLPADRDPLLQLRAGTCRERYDDDVVYVELSGELDAFAASQIREPLSDIANLAGDLVIDAKLVSFIDSAGLRLLEDLSARTAINGKTVWLHDPSRVVTWLMGLVGDEMIATCAPG